MTPADPRDEIVEHLPAMRLFALSLCRDGALADDFVQDAVVKAWTNFHQFHAGTNLRAWLFTILRNVFYSHHRKRTYVVEDADGKLAAQLATKPDHDDRLQFNDFLAALQTVNVEQREALILVGALGFSYEEAAETCQVPLGTIKSRANRARAQIAAVLGLTSGETLDMTDASTKAVMSRMERPNP